MSDKKRLPLILAVTGASGAALAKRSIDRLQQLGYPLIVVCSSAGERVWRDELGEDLDGYLECARQILPVKRYPIEDIGAPIASGRLLTVGMLVLPCSMNALSAFAHGRSDDLIGRAADVTIKEGRRLVLVPRETPLSAIHLQNMLTLARLGVRIVPPVPAFYLSPRTVDDIIDELVTRALRALGLPEMFDIRAQADLE